ncbi:MAG: hypothetical protein KC615_14210 [Anaerolineae bacterium]|nr:hypothetical protein [Anaerolineae bacterium]
MKLFTPIAIVCDHSFAEEALAIRAILESFRLRVDFYRLVQKPQLAHFFQNVQYPYSIIMCHGSGTTAEDMHLALQVGEQKDGDYDQTDGWSVTTVKVTPQWIKDNIHDRQGALISTACGSGREPIAHAFLQSGYSSYIAPIETYYDATAGFIFVTNYFYFLMSEDRDYIPYIYTEEQAFEHASKIDSDYRYGPQAFRRYVE